MAGMDILFKGSVAKHFEYPDDNEDAFRVAAERGRIVISDGASESFDGKGWAGLLVDQFSETELSGETLNECLERFSELHDPASLSWAKIGSWERGSFATLLIAQQDPATGALNISCVGDSCAVLTNGEAVIEITPYSMSENFQGKPILCSTINIHNKSLIEDGQICATWNWDCSSELPLYILCMTDAMGAWLLHSIENKLQPLKQLLAIRSEAELADLVESERQAGKMRRDDCTLVIARMETGSDT